MWATRSRLPIISPDYIVPTPCIQPERSIVILSVSEGSRRESRCQHGDRVREASLAGWISTRSIASRNNSMNSRSNSWSRIHRGKGRLSQEAGSAMFQGLRIRLTLWYCGVLGVALLLFGVALYFGTQYFLLTPIESDAARNLANKVNLVRLPVRVSRGPSRLHALTRTATCCQVKVPQVSHPLFSRIRL